MGVNRPSLLGTQAVRSAAQGRSSPGPGRGSHRPPVAGTRAIPVTPSLLCRCLHPGPGPDQRNGESIYRRPWQIATSGYPRRVIGCSSRIKDGAYRALCATRVTVVVFS